MISPLAYRPRPGSLQSASPLAAAAYLGGLALPAFLFSNPLLLVAVAFAAGLAGYLAGVGAAVRFALRIGLVLALLLIIVNGIAVSRGATVIMRLGDWPLLGHVDVSLEALAAGSVIGLRALAVMIIASVYSAAVDPDRILRTLRPWLGRSALTAGLASRLLPVALADAGRLREASRLRGPGAVPVGRSALARRLLAGSLDRSVDLAATLELRGYGLKPQPLRKPRTGLRNRWKALSCSGGRSRHDRRFLIAGALLAIGSLAAWTAGIGGFETYPRVDFNLDLSTLALVPALAASGAVPLRRKPRRSRGTNRGS